MTYKKLDHVEETVDRIYSDVKKTIDKLKDDIPNDGEIRREKWDIVYNNAIQQLTGFTISSCARVTLPSGESNT